MGILDPFTQAAETRKREAEQAERTQQQQTQRAALLEAQEKAATAERARQAQEVLDRAKLPATRGQEAGPAERLVADENKQRVRDAANAPAAAPKPEPQPEKTQERPTVATEKEHKFQPAHPPPSMGPGNFTSRTAQRESLAASLQRLAREADAAMTPAQKAERDQQKQEQSQRLENSRARVLFDSAGRSRQ